MAATYLTSKLRKIKHRKTRLSKDKKGTRNHQGICPKSNANGCKKGTYDKLKAVSKVQTKQEENASAVKAFVTATWCQEIEVSMYTTVRLDDNMNEYVANKVVNAMHGATLTQVVLDKQADISVIHPIFLLLFGMCLSY
jgi:hypothetical protein